MTICKTCNQSQAAFGKPGGSAIHCGKHREANEVNLRSKKCEVCGVIACFGKPGKCAKHCKIHKLPNEINLRKKLCAFEGCKLSPSFAEKGQSAKHCKKHKKENEINIILRMCNHDKCIKYAVFGPEGKVQIHCPDHKQANEINIFKKRQACKILGCGIRAIYGISGKQPQHCAKHKLHGEVNVQKPTCSECHKTPSYAAPGLKAIHCNDHKKENEVNVRSAKCNFNGCAKQASFGPIKKAPIHCVEHKSFAEISMHWTKICSMCGLPFPPRRGNKDKKECEYCSATLKAGEHEKKVFEYLLQTKFYKFAHNRQTSDDKNACGKYRPDFVYDFKTHFVIVECDEDQHRHYERSCENVRMENIVYGLGLPSVFIRWNPDDYKMNGVKQNVPWENRMQKLLEQIEYNSKEIPKEMLTIIYLYYDNIAVV